MVVYLQNETSMLLNLKADLKRTILGKRNSIARELQLRLKDIETTSLTPSFSYRLFDYLFILVWGKKKKKKYLAYVFVLGIRNFENSISRKNIKYSTDGTAPTQI